ncbi:uncharacterized protein CMU_005970 [Cryptosporidium muris RN66]|uniref:Uncharacterized protein n=1 Tax=Cryptosporidium muris (strain RN66) TaxID=441375 RepID=B6AHH9_CRYMR|nr:uncharacterized protein CMU_005970 [Cryptosporidium muris RN66]EEA07674.1 hypothetical protein, conserved [Cryptosporidium muris RN66]|eukprot:XP_002142023.1 hypothetical protein [Cryptosporidium muris RN66]
MALRNFLECNLILYLIILWGFSWYFIKLSNASLLGIIPLDNVVQSPNSNSSDYSMPGLTRTDGFSPINKKSFPLVELYREMTQIKNETFGPMQELYINKVLIPKTDAKVAKLRAETEYIETKNAAKRKVLRLTEFDDKPLTPFTNTTNKIKSWSSSRKNKTDENEDFFDGTFYYWKNVSNTS